MPKRILQGVVVSDKNDKTVRAIAALPDAWLVLAIVHIRGQVLH